MKLTLRQQLTQFGHVLQSALFPALEEELGELGEPAKRLIASLEMIPLARFGSQRAGLDRPSIQRPPGDRLRLCRQSGVRVRSHAATARRSGAGRTTAADLRLARGMADTERIDVFTGVRRVRADGIAPVCA